MKIDLCYPKIPRPKSSQLYGRCAGFAKYDGTNLHWLIEDGQTTAFGTRRSRYPFEPGAMAAFGRDFHHGLTFAPYLYQGIEFNPPEGRVFLFTEYTGPNSFNGQHFDPDEDMRLVLFDIAVGDPSNLLPPDEFLATAEQLAWPDVAVEVYRGPYNGKITEAVRQGKYKEHSPEGVVFKGLNGRWRVKIKTDEFEARIRP